MGSPIEGWTRQSAVKCAVNYSSGCTFKLEQEAEFPVITIKTRKTPLAGTLLPSIHYVSGSYLGRDRTHSLQMPVVLFSLSRKIRDGIPNSFKLSAVHIAYPERTGFQPLFKMWQC
jgi:hypothetical protein